MSNVISAILLISGSLFLFLAALGLVRMPDLFTRMQAGTKASTLGVALMLTSVAVEFQELRVATLVGAGVVFFFLTAPVAAHIISRAAYFVGVPLWERTLVDELRGQYDLRTHILDSQEMGQDVASRREERHFQERAQREREEPEETV